MPTFTNISTGRTGSTQDWIVPTSGSYRITAKGARGGYAYLLSSTTQNPGGNGAVLVGDFDLVAGHTIRMMVGQQGGDNPRADRGAGGGGGTFVYNVTTGTILMAAGGGGGGGQYANGTYKHATIATTGNPGMSGGNTSTLANGGTGPNGGTVYGSYAGAGAGYSGNGQDATYGQGGDSYTNGGYGGIGYNDNDPATVANYAGGYGGGGGSYAGAGGGGGYGGGGNGSWSYSGDGGGGGSLNNGTNQSNTVSNTGHGSVEIIANNLPPTAPTNLTPISQSVPPGTPASVSWTHNDPDGDPQVQYRLRWREAD